MSIKPSQFAQRSTARITDHRRPSPLAVTGRAAATLPDPPVMAEALIRLELLMHGSPIDLAAITSVMASDLGLTVLALKLAADYYDGDCGFPRMGELVVHLGIENLKRLIATATLVSDDRAAGVGMRDYARHARKARMTALIARDLVDRGSQLDPDQAYLAGLVFRLGGVPASLGWRLPWAKTMMTAELGYALAQAWRFPEELADLIHGESSPRRKRGLEAMLDLVTVADEWAELVAAMPASLGPLTVQ